ncbi:unnamed protein product [Staurois parvus]|uniref:Uncharacterized protein n=1 Tax=Staurois parvus TaxID=386267 RepID=A0ABN9F5R1_9NEOB|nr:unnamed protein product [Staurois parvus]
MILHFPGGKLFCLLTVLTPCRLGHTALDGCAQHSYPEQCADSKAHPPTT